MGTTEDQPHQFGSIHTALKLQAFGSYLPAYTTALKNLDFTLHYIDAFAGTGVCYIKVGDQRLMVPGSASLAIACTPKFDRMVFIEKSRRKAGALRRLKDAAAGCDITIIREDANVALPSCIEALNRRSDRAIVFLDPYGMQVEWETLRQVADSRIADVWYLFPLSGLYRQATRDAAAMDDDKSAALTRIFGTDEWRTAFYRAPPQASLFGDESDVRTAEVPEMLAWVKKRLETIFPKVARPKVLHQITKTGKPGAPLFALFFAVSNPSERAQGLALRIANGVLSA